MIGYWRTFKRARVIEPNAHSVFGILIVRGKPNLEAVFVVCWSVRQLEHIAIVIARTDESVILIGIHDVVIPSFVEVAHDVGISFPRATKGRPFVPIHSVLEPHIDVEPIIWVLHVGAVSVEVSCSIIKHIKRSTILIKSESWEDIVRETWKPDNALILSKTIHEAIFLSAEFVADIVLRN